MAEKEVNNRKVNKDEIVKSIEFGYNEMQSITNRLKEFLDKYKEADVKTVEDTMKLHSYYTMDDFKQDCMAMEHEFDYLKNSFGYMNDDYNGRKEKINATWNKAEKITNSGEANQTRVEIEAMNGAEKWYAPKEKENLLF